jgi:hypothetical protein
MKESTIKISGFFLILGLCWISILGNSQDLKLDKKEKKEVRKAEKLKDYDALGTLLEGRKFLFLTDRTQSASGDRISNVIHADGSRFFFIFENPKNTSGRNSGARDNTSPSVGIRGFSIEGNIGSWELSKNFKNLSYSIRFDVNGSGNNAGYFYEITMNIRADKSASVEIKTLPGGSTIYTNYMGLIREY